MTLSYQTWTTKRDRDSYGRVIRETRERVTREVFAPADWAMYTAAGNRSLRQKAERLLAKVEKIWASDASFPARQAKVKAALVSFLASWERMGRSDSYAEAGDTAVRECVGSFHDQIVRATYGDEWGCDREWERNCAAAYNRIWKVA